MQMSLRLVQSECNAQDHDALYHSLSTFQIQNRIHGPTYRSHLLPIVSFVENTKLLQLQNLLFFAVLIDQVSPPPIPTQYPIQQSLSTLDHMSIPCSTLDHYRFQEHSSQYFHLPDPADPHQAYLNTTQAPLYYPLSTRIS